MASCPQFFCVFPVSRTCANPTCLPAVSCLTNVWPLIGGEPESLPRKTLLGDRTRVLLHPVRKHDVRALLSSSWPHVGAGDGGIDPESLGPLGSLSPILLSLAASAHGLPPSSGSEFKPLIPEWPLPPSCCPSFCLSLPSALTTQTSRPNSGLPQDLCTGCSVFLAFSFSKLSLDATSYREPTMTAPFDKAVTSSPTGVSNVN